MKSYNHLFEQLITRENIARAINNASKRKKRRPEVKEIYYNPEKYIDKIIDIIANNKFKPQTHFLFSRYDVSSRKERLIVQPYFYKNKEGEEVFEQIIHHAVIQVLKPIFMRSMSQACCGSVPGRGGSYGKRRLAKYIREHNGKEIKYCCKCDIRHFYENVNTDLLKAKFARIIHDERMLNIINIIIDSNVAYYEGKTIEGGLRIGFYFSQWFANFFLQDLDHYIKEDLKIGFYLRYVDDMVMLGANKKKLHKDFDLIKQYLAARNLTIKDNWQVFKFNYKRKDGVEVGRVIDYMGFKFHRDRITMRKSILQRAHRKARKIEKKPKPTVYDSFQMVSYGGWFKNTNTYKYFKKFILKRVSIKLCRKIISKKQKEKSKNASNLQTIRKPNKTA